MKISPVEPQQVASSMNWTVPLGLLKISWTRQRWAPARADIVPDIKTTQDNSDHEMQDRILIAPSRSFIEVLGAFSNLYARIGRV
jgi:hypothetical protein